jgi:PII-like signaling protein
MIISGQAKKLSIYVDETDKFNGKPSYEVLMDLFHTAKIAGVTVFRGVASYGSHGEVHTAKILELSTAMPLKIEVIDSADMIDKILPEVMSILKKGLVEVSDTNIIRYGMPGKTD